MASRDPWLRTIDMMAGLCEQLISRSDLKSLDVSKNGLLYVTKISIFLQIHGSDLTIIHSQRALLLILSEAAVPKARLLVLARYNPQSFIKLLG